MSNFHPVRFYNSPSRSVARLALILVGFVAADLACADVTTKFEEKKKKANPDQIIPEVRDSAAIFVAGKAVDIELVASTGTLKPVEFLIRQQPEHGTLSAVRAHPRETNRGIVTYTNRGGDAPLVDRFSFACRVDGGAVSAPAFVTLTGKSFEPKLELVDYVAADKVFLGGEAAVQFAMKNIGAADFVADIFWEEPWLGPKRIEIKSGELGRFTVLFQPKTAGVFRLEKFLQSGVVGSKLPLFGQCVRPLTVTPGRLVLTMSSSGIREGDLQLVNGQSEPLRVRVESSGRLQGGGQIEVPGGGKARVSLALPTKDVASYSGDVKVTSTHGSEMVAVVADAKPAELRVVSSTGAPLDLGAMPVSKPARGEVIIENIGGTASVIQAQVNAPLMVRPSGEAVRLEPGGRVVFAFSMAGDQPGQITRNITFIGDRAPSPVVVQMQVLPPEVRSAPPAATPQVTQSEVSPVQQQPTPTGDEEFVLTTSEPLLMAQLASSGAPVTSDRINFFLERVTSLELLVRTSSSLTVAWKSPSVKPVGWIIESAKMVLAKEGGGHFLKVWVPLKNWKIVDGGPGRVAARIEPLPSGARIELRIMGVDRDEKIAEPSPGFIMSTEGSWRVPAWVWRLSFIVVLGVVSYVLNKMRLGDWEWRFRRESKLAETDEQGLR